MQMTYDTGPQICPSDILISLSFYMAFHQSGMKYIRFMDLQMSLVQIQQIYSLENLSTTFSDTLNRERAITLDYIFSSRISETRGTINLLGAFFADPSRSAEFFLGDVHAQMAVSSLTSLVGNPSKHEVASQPLPPKEDRKTYQLLHHFLCIYHLSHASISSSVLVNFPKIDPMKLKIQGGDSGSDYKESNSNCEESNLNCENFENQPSKVITQFKCKECQDFEDSEDQLSKAVTRFLLVCCNRSFSHIVFYLCIEPSG